MGQSPPSVIYGADLWGRAPPVKSMGQIYGAEPYLCHLWGGAMGQSPPSAVYGAEPPQLPSMKRIYGADLWGRAIPVPSIGWIYGAEPPQ